MQISFLIHSQAYGNLSFNFGVGAVNPTVHRFKPRPPLHEPEGSITIRRQAQEVTRTTSALALEILFLQHTHSYPGQIGSAIC